MGKDVIIACDFSNKKEVTNFLDLFKEEKPFVKIGMELFYAEGPEIVKEIKKRGHKIFLDLKLHDIPNTVMKAMKVLSTLDIDMTNLHASGGSKMMKDALEGLTNGKSKPPILIAVTQLTSTDTNMLNNELLIEKSMEEVVATYGKLAKNSGLNGVVCSAHEAKIIHEICGKNFLTVTPGIRFSDDSKDDQSRVMTPNAAKNAGCDYIVVGRSITSAKDPVLAYKKCINDFID